MVDDRWARVDELVAAAMDRPEIEREAFVRDACVADAALCHEVLSLLAHADPADDFMEPEGRPAPLSAGSRLGSYEIIKRIGGGGMGEVYEARDVRVPRTVAVKVLPDEFRRHPQLLSRFEREARAIAQLSHPHICVFHDLGKDRDIDFLVMEHIDGETLRDRLKRGRLSVLDSVRYAREVALALDAAHRKGLLHRDIKPSNIMITRSGAAKVIDFGLAHPTWRFSSDRETESETTAPGVVVGTVSYMSPEQARGLPLDQRTDIFSLGVVIDECLRGRLPSDGETDFPPDVPAELRLLVARCLEPDLAKRVDSASWVASELERHASGRSRWPARLKGPVPLIGAAVALAAIAATFWGGGFGPSRPKRLSPPEFSRIVSWPSVERNSRVSPDKSVVSFISDRGGMTRIWMKKLGDDAEPAAIVTSAGRISGHVWSPDGRWIAYVLTTPAEVRLEVVAALSGGSPRISHRLGSTGPWEPVGWHGTSLYLRTGRSLFRFEESSTKLTDLTANWTLKPSSFDVRLDGRKVVYSAARGSTEDLWMANLDGTESQQLTNDEFMDRVPIWAGTDQVVFSSDRGGQADLWRLTLGSSSLEQVTFTPEREIPESSSADGAILTYQETTERADLWEIDPKTQVERPLSRGSDGSYWPSTMPGSRLLAFQRRRPVHRGAVYNLLDTDILFARPTGEDLQLAASRIADGFLPRLSPTGANVAFLRWAVREGSAVAGLYVYELSTEVTRQLTDRIASPQWTEGPPFDWTGTPMAWTADGQALYFIARLATGSVEVRRFSTLSANDSPQVVALAPSATEAVTELMVPAKGARLGLVRRGRDTAGVLWHDFRSGAERPIWAGTVPLSERIHLLGSRDSGAIVMTRSERNLDQSYRVDVLQVTSPTSALQVFRFDRAYPDGARYDSTGDTVYLTTVEGDIHNVVSLSMVTRAVRKVTRNVIAGVTFTGVELTSGGRLVCSRQERKQDISMIRSQR